MDFKHLEEAFGYFRACTLISLPTYTFGKQFIIAELGEIGFDHNPNCHSVYSFPVQSGSVQFYCLLIPNVISKPAMSELPLQLEILSNYSTLNVPSQSFICSCDYPCFLPLPPASTCNQTCLHDGLFSMQIFIQVVAFPEQLGFMTSPYYNRLPPLMKQTGILHLSLLLHFAECIISVSSCSSLCLKHYFSNCWHS